LVGVGGLGVAVVDGDSVTDGVAVTVGGTQSTSKYSCKWSLGASSKPATA
jgi:hypothetical protein